MSNVKQQRLFREKSPWRHRAPPHRTRPTPGHRGPRPPPAHLPSQLGSAWFHWWFLSHTSGSSSLSVYPGSQLKVTVDLMPKSLPCRWPLTGTPGSRQESDSRVTPGCPEETRQIRVVLIYGKGKHICALIHLKHSQT